MKSEPETYGIDQLQKDTATWWEGVRNYQARNFMMNEMSVGDLVLFYHSNAEPSGIVGLAKVSKKAEPDKTALNKKSEFFDPKASKENPIWFCVQISFVEKFKTLISLEDLRKIPELAQMLVLKKGQRLSVQPVQPQEYAAVVKASKR
jgi:predicted RNA-binding protein with PUA-like domain